MKIGFEVKPFNYNLKSRRLELGYTQKELAIDARVQTEFIGRLAPFVFERMIGRKGKKSEHLHQ